MKGHIEKRAKGSWTVVIDLGYNSVKSKRERIYRSVQGPKREAEKLLHEMMHQLQTGTYIDPTNLTLGEYLERWLKTHGEQNLSPKTLRSYRLEANNHIIPELGAIMLEKLSPLQLQEYYSNKLANGRKDGKGGLSPRTLSYHHRIIHEALKHAVQWQLINRNIADAVVPPRYKKWEMAVLNREEAVQLLEQNQGHRDYSIIYTAIYTGMRQGELLGLRWSDVDLNRGILQVNQQLQYLPGQGYRFSPPKTEKSRRQIPLGSSLLALLREHKRDQAREKLIQGPEYYDMDLVFCLINGKPLDPNNLSKRFKRIMIQFGRPEVRFHDLRHTCATLFMAAGVDAKKVQEILGHESIRTTLDIYGHVLPSMQREAVDRMNAFMQG